MPEPADRAPSGCRHCGLPERGHANRWTKYAHWHGYVPPTDQQIKARMLARRADRITPTGRTAPTADAPDVEQQAAYVHSRRVWYPTPPTPATEHPKETR